MASPLAAALCSASSDEESDGVKKAASSRAAPHCFTPFGQYWKEVRKISVHELFSNSRVQSFRYIREEDVASLIQSISQSAAFKSPVDLTEKLLTGLPGRLRKNAQALDAFLQETIDKYEGHKVEEGNEDIIDVLLKIEKQQKEQETWRLHPPGPLLTLREVTFGFEVNGYKIYPKTRIHVNVWAIGRDPKIWKDLEKFLPERFAGSLIDFNGQHFELLTFGGGCTGCPGMNIAYTTLRLALANLLYHFDWKLPEGLSKKDINMEEA
ncbi:cytochrome P450 71B34-like [Carica papaya]|uniref:cytochrome P450 71B34-like n=1 Tax=Carica papaya TaxID=3649 RepID=UPI000B8D1108|nr:cytochrome P450 71B34-like [Carica papaya]